jgi:hypothetical protein
MVPRKRDHGVDPRIGFYAESVCSSDGASKTVTESDKLSCPIARAQELREVRGPALSLSRARILTIRLSCYESEAFTTQLDVSSIVLSQRACVKSAPR